MAHVAWMNLKVLEIEHKKENDSLLPLYKRRIGPGEKGGEQWDSSCPTHVYIPLTLTKTVQSELISDFSGIHRIWQVLLVGEHQQESMRWSSSRASGIRSRSFESTTKMMPCVFWKSAYEPIRPSVSTYSGATEDGSCPDHQHPTQ